MKPIRKLGWDIRNVVIAVLSIVTVASVCATVAILHREPDPLDFMPVETDSAAERLEEDKGSAAGGSSTLSLRYSGEVTVNLADKTVHFRMGNPSSSGWDVVLLIEVTDGENTAVIGRTGRIPAGMQITETSLITDYARLSAGQYDGQIRVMLYDSETGARTQFDSLLKDIVITVTEGKEG